MKHIETFEERLGYPIGTHIDIEYIHPGKVISALAQEVNDLREALKAKSKQIEAKEKLGTPSDNVKQMLVMLTTENKTQAKKIEELQADAERWRTFRGFFVEEPPNAIAGQIERANTPEELDAAIDAARKGETK